ncbi:MAG: FHA domain-containing protein [Planctomycetales bacterium]|nr:FHA domain-containing protein [Planctomycetales bacterium]NIM07959.1 FHA domain-containing protein [Planctomycetales bacterium]NIN07437.1 FHA domain-containing protein [Planctomycetales bacterium]NIN76541.1 FHA domain-containing protein [Planctomycetales bacterium]NIO33728.1 FHA domain-containing protein [Planctomycetales bacterium]
MPSLFVIQGRDRGHRYELEGPASGVGRDMANTVRLHDTEVSRRHAEIRCSENTCELVDLGSSNGTYVNGQRVERWTLSSGDQVQLGRSLLLFTAGADPSSAVLDDSVHIVNSTAGDESILHTLSHDSGDDILPASPSDSESPWLARARSNLQVMYRTALAVSHTMDIDELLNRIMELIFEWVEADRGCIMLMDSETGELEPKVRHNRAGLSDQSKISISKTILDFVIEHNEGVLTSNAKEDARWDTGASILQLKIREAICVPMRGRYGVVGVIYIDTSLTPQKSLPQGTTPQGSNKFTEEHLKLMVAIAHQAALAVEDTSYYSAMLQAERLAAVGQTIATLSHHIKNILQGIRGGSYLIEMGLAEDDKDVVQKGWHIVEKNQGRISNLVLDMLTFSKEREPELVEADLNETVSDVVELMHSRATELQVGLHWSPAEDIPKSNFDPEGIHRAVLNLVTNALDACESTADGQVTVATNYNPEEKLFRVIVKDTGSGIPPEQLEKMFTIFVSSKGSRGTGLGLSVSQKICKEHGGRILVDSKVGSGSRFTMEIPYLGPCHTQTPDADQDNPSLSKETLS